MLRVIRVAFDISQHVRYPAYLGPAIRRCEHRDRRDSSPRTGASNREIRTHGLCLPNKPRGVPRVNDRRVLNGIFWILRSGAPWRDLPEGFGPYTTCYNRFVRWRMAGIWDLIMEALAEAHDGSVQMIDTSIVRVHQHGGCAGGGETRLMGRSRGGLRPKYTLASIPTECPFALN